MHLNLDEEYIPCPEKTKDYAKKSLRMQENSTSSDDSGDSEQSHEYQTIV
jgi:hypothetical protein